MSLTVKTDDVTKGRKDVDPPGHFIHFYQQCKQVMSKAGLKIAIDTVANATNIFSLATKNSSLVTKVATRFLYDLDLN